MKNTAIHEQIKGKITHHTKVNFANSVILKQLNVAGKINNNRQPKQINAVERKYKDKKLIECKRNSMNQLVKKSQINIMNTDICSLIHNLDDFIILDTQQEVEFALDDTKHFPFQLQKKDKDQAIISSQKLKKKNSKNMKVSEPIQNIKIQKSYFQYMYIIGKGGFGKVWKVEHKKTKTQYAMKEMLKSIVMTKKSVQSVMNERVLLAQISSPFIVNMHFAFQDRDTLFLVLDMMEGGDLRHHIGDRFFSEIQSKFFIACLILGLEDLRINNIIHRDIKPQNLVLDSRGYVRITDLGIARICRPNNFCDTSGTPGYMSPEVICRMSHSFVSDYFAVGVIAYELITGRRPYNGRSRNQIRDLMLAKQIQLKYEDISQEWSCDAADFINKLIKRKPENRLGFNSIDEIKAHPWLNGLNWLKLRSKEIESPFIPTMNKNNFDQDEQITIEDQQQAELIEKNSLLLRKSEFQEMFNSYYFSVYQSASSNSNNINLKERQKKYQDKRLILGQRKLSHYQQTVKKKDFIPQKKFSYNQPHNHKKVEVSNRNDRAKPIQICLENEKQRKVSNHREKIFFR